MDTDAQPPSGTEPPGRGVLSVPEAGSLLGLGRSASYEAARRGDLPVLRFGRRLVVPRARILRMLGVAIDPIELGSCDGSDVVAALPDENQ
jgi:excisionase family DNA binding protein